MQSRVRSGKITLICEICESGKSMVYSKDWKPNNGRIFYWTTLMYVQKISFSETEACLGALWPWPLLSKAKKARRRQRGRTHRNTLPITKILLLKNVSFCPKATSSPQVSDLTLWSQRSYKGDTVLNVSLARLDFWLWRWCFRPKSLWDVSASCVF